MAAPKPATLKACVDEFDRYFTSRNGIDVGVRIEVPTAEWRELRDAIRSALGDDDVPMPDLPVAPKVKPVQPLSQALSMLPQSRRIPVIKRDDDGADDGDEVKILKRDITRLLTSLRSARTQKDAVAWMKSAYVVMERSISTLVDTSQPARRRAPRY